MCAVEQSIPGCERILASVARKKTRGVRYRYTDDGGLYGGLCRVKSKQGEAMSAEQMQTPSFSGPVAMVANAAFREVSREPVRLRLSTSVQSFHRVLWSFNGIRTGYYAQ